jgi:hypothetical protein
VVRVSFQVASFSPSKEDPPCPSATGQAREAVGSTHRQQAPSYSKLLGAARCTLGLRVTVGVTVRSREVWRGEGSPRGQCVQHCYPHAYPCHTTQASCIFIPCGKQALAPTHGCRPTIEPKRQGTHPWLTNQLAALGVVVFSLFPSSLPSSSSSNHGHETKRFNARRVGAFGGFDTRTTGVFNGWC